MSGTFCPVACMAAKERNVSNMVQDLDGVWLLDLGTGRGRCG